jgi:hypothetical protein
MNKGEIIMSNKKTILILILIVSAVILLIAILITVYKTPSIQGNNVPQVEKNDLYFVTEVEGTGYGICRTDGTVVLKPEYSQIARVDNSVYLKTETDSSIYFLDDGKSVSLGGKESEVYFVYDAANKLLPYFILRYGESEQASIYRIFNDKGIRHDTRDFSSLNEAYKFLNAKELFVPVAAPTSITSMYNVITTLNYPTSEGKSQYIVTKKNSTDNLKGLVDELGRVILECSYKSISNIQDSKNAIMVEKNDKTYIFLSTEKLVEVEAGFEFLTSNGYFIQKRGNTVNKVYNLSGEVVIDGIYNLKDDFVSLNLKTGTSYMLVQEKKSSYSLYNMTTNKKSDNAYTDVVLDYISSYGTLAKNTAFIYKDKESYYAVDLNNLKSYKMIISSNVFSPLDLGIIYKIK